MEPAPGSSSDSRPSSKLRITLRRPLGLTPSEREGIAAFVTRSIPYPRARFDAAVDGADYLWLAHDAAGKLVGTSAIRLIPALEGQRAVTLVYTAMVVIDPSARRHGLIRRFGLRSYLLERARSPFRPIYWLNFAASPAGFVSMARNFETFWPQPQTTMPPVARSLFRQAFAALGIDKVEEVEGWFRLPDDFGVEDPSQAPHRWDRSDPLIDFFLRVNPDYQRGSDLPCLCPLGVVPLGAAVARQIRRQRRDRAASPAVTMGSELVG